MTRPAPAWRLPLAALAMLMTLSLFPLATTMATAQANTAAFDIPGDAITVCATDCGNDSLQAALDGAEEGATIVVDGGSWDGPIEITTPVHLIGINGAVIDGHDQGTVVQISAPGTTIQGFVIQNSGSNFDKEDSAIYIDAEHVQVLDNTLVNTLFGVNVAQGHDGVIARNVIEGKDYEMGMRGDGIKVWYSHRIQVTDNIVTRSRDLLIWYSNDVVVTGNDVQDSRYGFHFMNSDNGVATGNRMSNNSVAIYLMYGRNFIISDNLLQGSRGPSGHGLGLKEIDGVVVEGNVIFDNRIGVFIDNSPLSPNVYSYFRGNLVAFNDSGFAVLPSTRNNVLTQNSIIDNLEQVTVLGGGQLGDNAWSENGVGNFWSDYAGYDADGDGVGELAFRSEVASEQVMSAWPTLQLFRFSVAAAAIDFGSKAMPMFRQDPVLVDEYPLISPVLPENAPLPVSQANPTSTSIMSLVLLVVSGAAIWWGIQGTRSRNTTASNTASGSDVNPGTVGVGQTTVRGNQP